MGPAEPNNMTAPTSKGYSIPKLAHDGSNWMTWKSQTLATLAASRGVSRHVEGTVRTPPPVPKFDPKHVITEEEDERMQKNRATLG